MKMKLVSTLLCGLLSVGLLCGFAAPPAEENTDLVPRQFQTAQQIDRISVENKVAVANTVFNVTIRTTDTDHITVDYADTAEKPLYAISAEDGLLSIQTTTDKTSDGRFITIDGKNIFELTNCDLVITLPQKQYQDISVGLTIGTLSVEGVKAAQLTTKGNINSVKLSGIQVDQLNASSSAGKVTLRDSQIGGAEINGAVGDVTVENVTSSGQMNVSSSAGKVILRDSQIGSAEINGTVGDVTVENVTVSGQMNVSSNVGKVQLKQVTADKIIVQVAFGNLVLKDVKSREFSKEIFGFTLGEVSLP